MLRSTLTAFSSALMLSACMLTPTDDGTVARREDPLSFSGYHNAANAPVQVKAWSFTRDRMVNVGAAVRSSATAAPASYFDDPIYAWSASRTLGSEFWRAGPAGGFCARVGADTVQSGRTQNMMTVDPDWGRCYAKNKTSGTFFANCRSDNSPTASVYTNDWGRVTVDGFRLAAAALVARNRLSLVLDNYTPVENQFCDDDRPESCPDPRNPQPNSFKFYHPEASSLTADGDALTFSIPPAREDPMTVYIDDIRSSGFTLQVDDGALVLGINFESNGTEVRLNCIDNFICGVADGITVELGSPRAELRFPLVAKGGKLGYDTMTATFTATGGERAQKVAAAMGEAMQEMLLQPGEVREQIEAGLELLVRGAAGLDAAFPIRGVQFTETGLVLNPGCPQD